MTLSEKAAYIKGLADGLEFDATTAEGKLLKALIDLVSDMCVEINETNQQIEYLKEYTEEIDEDLGDVEEFLLDDDCCDCDCCDDDCDCCDDDCDCCNCCDDDDIEVICPECNQTVHFCADIAPEDLVCPACGEKFECLIEENE